MDKQLSEYIKSQLQAGTLPGAIKKALLQSGWREVDIDVAMTQFVKEAPIASAYSTNVNKQENSIIGVKPFYRRRFAKYLFTIFVVLVAVLGIAWWRYYYETKFIYNYFFNSRFNSIINSTTNVTPLSSITIAPTQSALSMLDPKAYINNAEGYKIQIPKGWLKRELKKDVVGFYLLKPDGSVDFKDPQNVYISITPTLRTIASEDTGVVTLDDSIRETQWAEILTPIGEVLKEERIKFGEREAYLQIIRVTAKDNSSPPKLWYKMDTVGIIRYIH